METIFEKDCKYIERYYSRVKSVNIENNQSFITDLYYRDEFGDKVVIRKINGEYISLTHNY